MSDFNIGSVEGFDWNEGNSTKNEKKHNVTKKECEEVFFSEPLFVTEDLLHSKSEKRQYALGITDHGRLLFISFTLRENKIRVISARNQSKKEREIYNHLE